jgi:hypothetical protein
MNISRRNFIKLGSAAFAATNFLIPLSANAAKKTNGVFGALPPEALADPFLYLTAADFKKYVGTEFSLITESGKTAAVLSNVTQVKPAKSADGSSKNSRRQPVAETFTLSFKLSKDGFRQETYRLWHPGLGEFDLFLVPEASRKSSLHAVINRI